MTNVPMQGKDLTAKWAVQGGCIASADLLSEQQAGFRTHKEYLGGSTDRVTELSASPGRLGSSLTHTGLSGTVLGLWLQRLQIVSYVSRCSV